MTRKSKREIESALDDIEASGSVDEWLRLQCREGIDICDEDTAPVDDALLVVAGTHYELYLPRNQVPEWIDAEADLPVRA